MSKRKVIETSKAAYDSLDQAKISELHRKIFYALAEIGDGSYEDVAKHLKMEPSKIWKRMSELHTKQLIERTGKKKKLSSGREGFLWRVKSMSVQDYSRNINAIAKQVKQLNLL